MACFIKCTLIKKSNYEAKPEIMSCLTKYSATLSDTDITYGVNANIQGPVLQKSRVSLTMG